MKIIIAPDSFKGCLSSREAAAAMEKGVRAVFPEAEIEKILMADGGEGTLEALTDGGDAELVKVETFDPLGRPVSSEYAVTENGETAIVEVSAASGLTLLKKEELNPMLAGGYGTGILIKHALEGGCGKLIVAVGGSATNDGGAGAAQALGAAFFRKDKSKIREKMSGGLLKEIDRVDLNGLHPAIREVDVIAACDVDNPLLGENGCARVYSPQKGADHRMVDDLEKNMARFIDIAEKAVKKSVRNLPGTGAGGGFGAGLMLFLGAEVRSGADLVMEARRFTQRVKNADIILTGEGKVDEQTARGKTISSIAKLAGKQLTPVTVFGGIVEREDELYNLGVTSCFPICEKPLPVEQALKNASLNLRNAVERAMRAITT